MTLEEQWEQWQEDVKQFGELAYLMWQIKKANLNGLGRLINDEWMGLYNNAHFECDFRYSEVRRKKSAALPFDLAAARAGDEVEFKNIFDVWVSFKKGVRFSQTETSKNNNKVDVFMTCRAAKWVRETDLRMKHPRRVGVDYSRFEEKS